MHHTINGNWLTADLVAWSPTPGRVAYLTDWNNHLQIWTALPDGRDTHLLYTQHKKCCTTPSTFPSALAWSPDGTKLILTGVSTQIINAATGTAHTLQRWPQGGHGRASAPGTAVDKASGQPAWRP
jgi:hypothetical protein